MSSPKPTRSQGDLAELLETLLDKGVVINADIAVTVGDTELLGIRIRAALASFETAAQYGLEFPSGTDMQRVHSEAGLEPPESQPESAVSEDTEDSSDSSRDTDPSHTATAAPHEKQGGVDTNTPDE